LPKGVFGILGECKSSEDGEAALVTAPGDNLSPAPRSRRLPTRSEAMTLLGMTAAIGSLFLPWDRLPPETAAFPAYYKGSPFLSGFQTTAHWPLTICAVVCGLALLWAPTANARLPLMFLQGLGGLLCLLIPLRQFVQSGFAPLPGVLVALIG